MLALFNPSVASGETFYRVNGGGWNSVAMSNTSGDTWNGDIPGIISPATVEYYFTGTDAVGNPSEFPIGGAEYLSLDAHHPSDG